jgi:hypothetical protein
MALALRGHSLEVKRRRQAQCAGLSKNASEHRRNQ